MHKYEQYVEVLKDNSLKLFGKCYMVTKGTQLKLELTRKELKKLQDFLQIGVMKPLLESQVDFALVTSLDQFVFKEEEALYYLDDKY